MNEDISYVAAMAVIIVAAVAVLVHLIPILFQVVWQVMPGILILLLIVGILHQMIKTFLE